MGMGVGVKPGRNGYKPVKHDFFSFQVEKGEINNKTTNLKSQSCLY